MLAFLPRQGIFSKTKFLAELLYKKHSLYLPGGLTMFFPHLPMASVQHSDKGDSAIPFFFTLIPSKPVHTINVFSLFKKGLTHKYSFSPASRRHPCNMRTKAAPPYSFLFLPSFRASPFLQ